MFVKTYTYFFHIFQRILFIIEEYLDKSYYYMNYLTPPLFSNPPKFLIS